MGWQGRLDLHYRRDGERTTALDRHHGPLRVLQRLYPEGPGICHHVLVHPPGGVVGGDTLAVHAVLDTGTHALLTTPGATRFYRSDGPLAEQTVHARVASGARLEWLPLETIAYDGCRVENRLRFELEPQGQMIGWDLLALGLPAAAAPFERGHFVQHLELPGTWLERGRIDAADTLLRRSPLGWAGHDVLATAWFAAGSALDDALRDSLLEAARGCIDTQALRAGATAAHPQVIVLRVLAEAVEPAMQLLAAVRAAWRAAAWGLAAEPPRIWRT